MPRENKLFGAKGVSHDPLAHRARPRFAAMLFQDVFFLPTNDDDVDEGLDHPVVRSMALRMIVAPTNLSLGSRVHGMTAIRPQM